MSIVQLETEALFKCTVEKFAFTFSFMQGKKGNTEQPNNNFVFNHFGIFVISQANIHYIFFCLFSITKITFVEADCSERMINIIISINKDRKKTGPVCVKAQIYIITYISSDRLNLTEKNAHFNSTYNNMMAMSLHQQMRVLKQQGYDRRERG